MSIELSKQKLDLDEAARELHRRGNKLLEDETILLAAILAIDKDGENILESSSMLAQDARKIMREISKNL